MASECADCSFWFYFHKIVSGLLISYVYYILIHIRDCFSFYQVASTIMDIWKCKSPGVASLTMPTKSSLSKVPPKAQMEEKEGADGFNLDSAVDIDLREVYFLIMHFLSSGPCQKTLGYLWSELMEHQLLPRRYHAWFSRSGAHSGHNNDDGISFPLSYDKLVERYLFMVLFL